MTFRLFLCCCLLCCGLAVGANPLALPDQWQTDNNATVTLAKWKGRAVILAMEFSNCRFICSINLQKLKEIQDEADKRKLELEFVIVSIDPAHDTPASWRSYRASRSLERTNWRFLTGDRAATERIAALLGVKWWYYDEHLMHDFKIFRLAPDGRIVGIMKTFDMTAAELLDGR